MCRGAGNAASAFGAALQVDSARTGATESLQHPAARGGNDADGGGDRSEAAEGARPGYEEDRETGGSKGGSAQQGGGVESGDSMRAELLALQLIECANEMEDHLNVQVRWHPPVHVKQLLMFVTKTVSSLGFLVSTVGRT